MSNLICKKVVLEGLHCANCASKIETKINELEEVKVARLNFITKTLEVELEDEEKVNSIVKTIKDIVKKYEPDVEVIEKVSKQKQKHNHNHNNEHCDGHCCGHDHNHDHGHDHGHDYIHTHGSGNSKKELIKMLISAAIFGATIVSSFSFQVELFLFIISYLIIGGQVVLRAIKNIFHGQVFDENFLMCIATLGAFAIGEYPEAVAVMLFYQAGEFMQDLAVNRSRKSISDLMDIRPDYANLKKGDIVEKVTPEEVGINDLIIVKPGEKIPLDGVVVEGQSMLDTSALTGESVPRKAKKGSEVLSGFINENGLLLIKVSKEFGESTVAKILDLVQNASSNKAPTENFITKFARYYTPVVVFTALSLSIIPPIVIEGATFSEWLYRALVFLVVSCPCALVISIPLSFFGGIGGASKNGILIKGGNYLEALNKVDTIVFDKTGTLTKGVFKVTKIKANDKFSNDSILKYAAYAESYSNHPIATSIIKEFGSEIDKKDIKSYEEISGYGVKAIVEGKEIIAGNFKLMEKININFEKIDVAGTIVYLAIDNNYAGYIIISDEIKEDSKESIQELKKLGIKQAIMLTGDNNKVAEKVASNLGIGKVYAELLPQQKVEILEELDNNKTQNSKLLFVGDGINDAPVLARADIGVAMGGLGSDAAIEAADVVLMTDEPSKLVSAIKIAKRTRKIVWQNIIFSLGIKGIVLILGAFGYATMWEAVFADVGVALIAVLNAMRVLNVKNIK